jgi:transcriptional regulator with XRE-family HTH domain
VAKLDVRNLGDYIREQRTSAQISLRQLAKLAGVSNPYLSQIERGLRKPSAEILQQLAKALRISAEALYVQAGILDERYGDSDVQTAIVCDATLTERQKQVLLEIYESFRRENDERPTGDEADTTAADTLATAPTAETDRRAVKTTAATRKRAGSAGAAH